MSLLNIDADLPLKDVVEAMLTLGQGIIPVARGGAFAGIWTETLLLEAARNGDPNAPCTADLLPDVAMPAGLDLRQALALFARTKVRTILLRSAGEHVETIIDQPAVATAITPWVAKINTPIGNIGAHAVTLRVESDLGTVADHMIAHDVNALPLVDDANYLRRFITVSDMLRCWYRFGHSECWQMPAKEIGTSEVVALDESAPASLAFGMMMAAKVRRVPITRQGGPVTGLISLVDILAEADKVVPEDAELA